MTLTQINKAGLDEIALDHVFTIGASGSSAYTFQGEGLNGTVNNPTLYLTRGKTYRFENGSGGHPIRIQSTSGASGTAYNTGVTNNAGSGTVIVEVQHDAPDVLYYQCTSHAAMNGILYITGALADGGVTTAKIADDAVNADKIGTLTGNVDFADSAKARFGTGNDLEIFHTGSNSFVDNNTGHLYLRNKVNNEKVIVQAGLGGDVELNVNYGEAGVIAKANGSVELYNDNSKKFNTYANGCTVTGNLNVSNNVDLGDNSRARFGAGNDLQIYHDGSNSFIKEDGTGNLYIFSANLRIENADGSKSYIEANDGGATELYHDGSKKLETSSTGATISGDLSLADNNSIKLGASNDLIIFHDSNGHSFLQDQGNGALRIRSDSEVAIQKWDGTTNENIAKFMPDGGVELYHDNVKALNTYANGIQVGFDQNNPRIMLPDNGIVSWGTSDSASIQATDAGSGGYMKFNVANANKLTINANGLCFNNDTAAANALHDYEEGVCSSIGITSTASSHVQKDSGTVYYTKIGRSVHLYGSFRASNLQTHFGGTHLEIHGFPFSVNGFGNSSDIMVAIWGGGFHWWDNGYPSISMENNRTIHGLYVHRTSGTQYSAPTGSSVGNSFIQVNFDLIYFTDA